MLRISSSFFSIFARVIENHPLFYEKVERYFDEDIRKRLKGKENCWYKSVEKEHGSVATREYFITEDVAWYSEREKWKKLNAFGMVKKTLERPDGSSMEEERYYICSIEEDVKLFERAARGHWGVENGLHWQLDFTFKDDKNTSMAKAGAKNLQIMKKIALAVLKLVKESYGLSLKRIRYAISLNYENEVEKIFSMLNAENIKNILESMGRSSQE
ncbi:MAG: ISAs1 family transposase [Lachnospiraceae bacterium]